MAFPIARKLVVGVSSRALFDLEEEDHIYKEAGIDQYKQYQVENRDKILAKGLAFPFVRRYLNINRLYPDEAPVEVVLLSRNSPETGLRIFNSIKEYGLQISRAAFTSGKSPYVYIPAFNVSLFLSMNADDVRQALQLNYPAGHILPAIVHDDDDDDELRVAFDFDGVIADDESERVFATAGGELAKYHEYEVQNAQKPLNPGILSDFFLKLAFFQQLEKRRSKDDSSYQKIVRTAIVTARNAPAHERAVNTLSSWNVTVDEMFFLGGIEKRGVLQVFRPHLFIDDQLTHLDTTLNDIALVHIPFGVANVEDKLEGVMTAKEKLHP